MCSPTNAYISLERERAKQEKMSLSVIILHTKNIKLRWREIAFIAYTSIPPHKENTLFAAWTDIIYSNI